MKGLHRDSELPGPAHALQRHATLLGMIAALSAGLATSGIAQDTSVERTRIERVQASLEEIIADEDTRFPGTVVHVSQPGVGSWSWAAGAADTATGQALAPDAKFRAGSLMKPFVAVVTLQLVEE